jgi:uncharacterized protein TP_0772
MLFGKTGFNRSVASVFLVVIALFISSCITTTKKSEKKSLSLPPRKLGVITASVVKRNSKELLPRDYSFVLITKTATLRIHHKLLGDNIWIFFPETERRMLVSAMEKYLDNYKTGLKGKKQKAYFGKETIQMVWGLLNAAHIAYPTVRFEYEYLKNGKPYFIIANTTIESTKNDANSPAMKIALSPLQCKKVLSLINDDAINKVIDALKKDFEQYDDEDFDSEENEGEEGSISSDEDFE